MQENKKNLFIFIGELPLVKNDMNRLIEKLKAEKDLDDNCIIIFDENIDLKNVLKTITNKSIYGKDKLIIIKNATFLEKEISTKHFQKFISIIDKLDDYGTLIIIHIDKLEFKLPKELIENAEIFQFDLNTLKDKEKKNTLYTFSLKLLEENNKKISLDTFNYLISLIGDDLVNLQSELEKIILFTDKQEITRDDIDQIVYKSNKEPLYELNSAILEKNLKKSLQIYKNLISQQIHPLIIASNIINLIKRLVIIKEILVNHNINKHKYDQFKNKDYLKLVEIFNNYSLDLFKDMHPYALFLLIKSEENFKTDAILSIFDELYKIDFMLKDSAVNHEVVLEYLLIKLCTNT